MRAKSLLTYIPLLSSSYSATTTTEIYTLSLHDALPISSCSSCCAPGFLRSLRLRRVQARRWTWRSSAGRTSDRKSTRLNSSHTVISYAVFCLKKKKLSEQRGCNDRDDGVGKI